MSIKLIETRLNEGAITDFMKGFGSGLGDSIKNKLGVEKLNDRKYKETISWFKKHKLEVSSLPGVRADVLSANLGGQILDIVINQNESKKIYIKLQGIVCPFSLLTSLYSSWQESDTQYLFDYANMMNFHRKEGEDKEYKGDSKTKYGLINTTTQNFYILYGMIRDFNIPFLNPNKVGVSPSEYNKSMLSDKKDITGDKKCNEFLVKYTFMLLYITYNTPDKVLEFAEGIGIRGDELGRIEDILNKDASGVVKGILSREKDPTKVKTQTAEFQKRVQTQPRKDAIAEIVRQIFET